ncbi:hypothetical protein F2P81_021389 [Scophthalmus maximus]|uniref:Uncharacterized protein n=1 Tax=Scophthalmus maximus TaxID=52904 RepID=A0A6A4S5P8_SCOMX|nr:hypothetical protein F2P81_021389 [Scophthalmus maximus]
METKPVITCLKTLLIVYSFVFWFEQKQNVIYLLRGAQTFARSCSTFHLRTVPVGNECFIDSSYEKHAPLISVFLSVFALMMRRMRMMMRRMMMRMI